MNGNDFKNNTETESKAKRFWKTVGIVFLSLALSALTVLIINI